MSASAPPPTGAPLAAYVEGILDGRVGDAAKLLEATAALGRTGAGAFRCDIQGGRFSLLPVETSIPGSGFDDDAQARFLAALQHLLAGAVPGTVEANLRCRLVHADEVAETLFVVRGDRIEPLTRRRPRTPADVVPAVVAATSPLGLRRREALWLAPVLLLAAVVVAWQGGWIDRVLAARAETLRIDTGPFGAMLAVSATRSWGNYEVSLRRGADYPATPQVLAERMAGQTEHAMRTACSIVGDGRDLFVQVVDAGQKVLAEVRADVRPLLTGADAVVVAKLPGLMSATGVRLSVVAAPRPQ